MGTTQPIRNKEDLKKFMEYYQTVEPNQRNRALITVGLYTALRISDILDLKWEDVYDFKQQCFLEHILVHEHKTGKISMIAMNTCLKDVLTQYYMERQPESTDFLFSKPQKPCEHLCRSQAYRIVRKAAENVLHEPHISCHSLRKTFGYQAWKQGASPVLLMDIYNHSSFSITKRYLGIKQDERDKIFQTIEF